MDPVDKNPPITSGIAHQPSEKIQPMARGWCEYCKIKGYQAGVGLGLGVLGALGNAVIIGYGFSCALTGLARVVDSVARGRLSQGYHSMGRFGHSMPIQATKELFSSCVSSRETIKQSDIDQFKEGITCGKDNPLPDDSNKLGATRVLASYLHCCGLKINSEGKLEKVENVTAAKDLTDPQLESLNGLLANVLGGSGVPENQLGERIHKAFEAVIKGETNKNKDRKAFYDGVAESRGAVWPTKITNEVTFDHKGHSFAITDQLTAYKPSEGSWASGYCKEINSEIQEEDKIPSPISDTRVSECKNNKHLQTSAMNLQVHTVEIKKGDKDVLKKRMIRGGAPCTHQKKSKSGSLDTLKTEKLFEKAAKFLTFTPNLSTYEKYQLIQRSNNSELASIKKELERRERCSTSQMLGRLQAAYASADEEVKAKETFVHSEMGFLSPGDAKEKSMIMDVELAIGNISSNYSIAEDGSKVQRRDRVDGSPPGKEIKIIFTQMGINENQVTQDPLQDFINLRACLDLRGIIGNESEDPEKMRCLTLLREIEHTISQEANRKYADEGIVHKFDEIYSILRATTGVFCKSGKDRTSQQVSDAVAEELGRRLPADPSASSEVATERLEENQPLIDGSVPEVDLGLKDKVRSELQKGSSWALTGGNTGHPNGYAFNLWQLSMLPKCFRPSWFYCSSGVHS